MSLGARSAALSSGATAFWRMARSEFRNSQPQERLGISGVKLDFLLQRSSRVVETTHLVVGDAQEHVACWYALIQNQSFLQRRNRVGKFALA